MTRTTLSSRSLAIRFHAQSYARRWLNIFIYASFSILTCTLSSPAFAADWWNASWSKCREITIANTGTSLLTDFPAYISLSFDSDMQSDYDDIRFINTTCNNNGSELDFEIESHTATSADIWVKIDNLPIEGTTIAVYYGNASAASGEDINGTWDTYHQGVWHLGENTDDESLDSTSNSNDGQPHNSPASYEGKIGRALNFDVSDKTYVKVGKDDSLKLYDYENWTISLWVKPFSDFTDNKYPVMYTNGDYEASVGLDKDDGKIEHWRNDSSTLYNNTELTTNVWNHVVVTRTKVTTRFYLNGNSNGSGTSEDMTEKKKKDSYIGGFKNYTDGDLKGVIDEVRVSNILRTSDWIKQSYEIVQNQNTHVSIGVEVGPAMSVDHFEIQHDGNGFTCEAEDLTIKACADANCDALYAQETSITLSPSGWSGSDTIVFTGEITTSLSVTDEGTVSFAKISASPDADLHCYIGSAANCEITFSNDGFELYGENTGDTLPDQLAANNFQNVNLRAVRSNNNVCEALLQGTQNIDLTYDCDSPDQCLTSLSGISITGDGTGGNTGNIEVEFNAQGEASLAVLNYPDAGRLILSIQAEVDGVTINSSDNEAVDVYPSYLQLTVDQSELLYGSSSAQNNYIAGEPFTVSIGAYGVNDALLPNYQAESPQLKVTRIQPASAGSNGHFKYSDTGTISSQLTAGFTSVTGLSFSAGEHQYTKAYYDEVGRINIDVKDNSYLGNEILSNGSKTLGDFYPAYFGVALSATPSLADTCGIFSYIGETITFATDPELTITAYNALNVITENYSDNYWNYLPNESTLEANLSFMDTSTYHLTGTAIVIDLGDAPLITNNDNYNGSGTVTITNGRFRYNKVDPVDNRAFSPVSPFDAEISLAFSSHFFNSTFVDQNGNLDTICYQASYSDNTCLEWDIEEVTGTQMRYGRLTLESTYGPEVEPLNVPIKAEYFNNSQWLLNTDDSNCTSIALTETAGQIILTAIDGYDLDLVGDVISDGVLISGLPVGDQFKLKTPNSSQIGPGTQGQLALSLDPTAIDVEWPNHLNYDWDGDGFIDIDDFPKATITFGLFRGSDRIIQWREVSN
ncbi:MAG: MSHA biogenesis protein MshQ [Paraglaciecola sp.]|jgi:MSHA biogenesis protein MshQ